MFIEWVMGALVKSVFSLKGTEFYLDINNAKISLTIFYFP